MGLSSCSNCCYVCGGGWWAADRPICAAVAVVWSVGPVGLDLWCLSALALFRAEVLWCGGLPICAAVAVVWSVGPVGLGLCCLSLL